MVLVKASRQLRWSSGSYPGNGNGCCDEKLPGGHAIVVVVMVFMLMLMVDGAATVMKSYLVNLRHSGAGSCSSTQPLDLSNLLLQTIQLPECQR